VELPHLGLFGWPGALERVKRRPFALLGVLPFVMTARRRLAQTGPFDALVAHWSIPGFWPVSRDFEGPTTVIAHGSDVRLLERLPTPLKRRVLDALCRPNVSLRCVSTELLTRVQRLAAVEERTLARTCVEPCAIVLPTLPDRTELRRALLGRTTAPLVVVVGRVVKDKQIPLAIAAVEEALDVSPTIIGDGPELGSLRARFPQAKWLGQCSRTETLQWIKAADLLLSASEREGAPTVVREARALGTRVVAAEAGDLKLWAATDPGLFVVRRHDDETDDPSALTRALARAITQALEQTA
jgi:glycosyltransferase involved in cell wall biosynthesis